MRRILTSIYPRVVLFVIALVGLSFYLTSEMQQLASQKFVERELVDLRDETSQLAYQLLDALDGLQDDLELHGELMRHEAESRGAGALDANAVMDLIEQSNLSNRDYLHVQVSTASSTLEFESLSRADLSLLPPQLKMASRLGQRDDPPVADSGSKDVSVDVQLVKLGDAVKWSKSYIDAMNARYEQRPRVLDPNVVLGEDIHVAVGTARIPTTNQVIELRLVLGLDAIVWKLTESTRHIGSIAFADSGFELVTPGKTPLITFQPFTQGGRVSPRVATSKAPIADQPELASRPLLICMSEEIQIGEDRADADHAIDKVTWYIQKKWVQEGWKQPDKPIRRVGFVRGGDGSFRLRLVAESARELAAMQTEIQVLEWIKGVVSISWMRPYTAQHYYEQQIAINLNPVTAGSTPSTPIIVRRAVWEAELRNAIELQLKPVENMGQIGAIALAIAALVFSVWMVRPFYSMTEAAGLITEAGLGKSHVTEQLEVRVERAKALLPTGRNDELGILARAFEEMLTEVERGHAELEDRVRDRTQRLEAANKELDQARIEAEAVAVGKDEFLASVSHELRSPLNAMFGFLQFLQMTDLDDQQRQDLGKIRTASQSLLDRVNDILDYQKIVMRGMTLEPEQVAVEPALRSMAEQMSVHAAACESSLEVHVDDGLPEMFVDPKRLDQILTNLISNACKFKVPERPNVVTLSARMINSAEIEFVVQDTGRGMKREEQGELFQKFRKLSTRGGNRAGTGLGLVICRGLCKLMGGDIAVQSEYGEGSTFRVTLPMIDAGLGQSPLDRDTAITHETAESSNESSNEKSTDTADNVVPTSREQAADKAARTHKQAVDHKQPDDHGEPTLLVIDDDPDVVEFVERAMRQHGFRVINAPDGSTGLQMALEQRPDLITLDARMPGLDGFSVLAALKNDDELREIPVVMVTVMEDRQRAFSLGAADYVVKPLDLAELTSVLKKHCPTRQHVLVVDDDQNARELLRRGLEPDGWTIDEAADGREALDALERMRPAAVLLDLAMPVMSGFEFLAEFHARPEWEGIPVIVITALDFTTEERRELEGSVAGIIQKTGYRTQDLIDELRRKVGAGL